MIKKKKDAVAILMLFSSLVPFFIISGKVPMDHLLPDTQVAPSSPRQATRAVIHMGVHKTGSTSIQIDSWKFNRQLKRDGYYMPWVEWREHTLRQDKELTPHTMTYHQVNFAACFLYPTEHARQEYPCDPDLLLSGLKIAQQNRSMLVTAESLSRMDVQGIQDLYTYLKRSWDDVLVVVFYRRYYSWCVSYYNQFTKYRKWPSQNNEQWNKSILDFLTVAAETDMDWYAANLVIHLRPFFRNIMVASFHDDSKGGPSEHFYCHILPHAKHTCAAVRNRTSSPHENKAENLDYSDLVYAANKTGLITINSQEEFKTVTVATEKFHQHDLNASAMFLKHKCLSKGLQEKLLDKSLRYERLLFPDYTSHDNPVLGKESMRKDFETFSISSLCELDAKETLSEAVWQNFFKFYHENQR